MGAIIRRPDGLVLTLERSGQPGSWQFPQGGIEDGESPERAVLREVAEEAGIPAERLRLAATSREWLSYELPPDVRNPEKHGLGQTQRWFLFDLVGSPEDVVAREPEFTAVRWTSLRRAVTEVVGFKRPVYEALAAEFGPNFAPPDGASTSGAH